MTRSLRRVSQSSVSLPTPMALLLALVVAATSWHAPPLPGRISARHQPCIAVQPPAHASFRHASPVAAAGAAEPNERFSLLPTRGQISISKDELGRIITRTWLSFAIIISARHLGLKLLTANVAAASLLSFTEGLRSVARVTTPLAVVHLLLTTIMSVVTSGPVSGLFAASQAATSALIIALLQWLYIPAHFVSILAYGEGFLPFTCASKEHLARMSALLRTNRLGALYCDTLKDVALKLNGFLGVLTKVHAGLLSVFSTFMTITVVGPICEELVFRWLLQRGLQRLVDERAATRGTEHPASRRLVYFIVSVLFALMHAFGPMHAGAATASPTSISTSRLPTDILGQVACTGIASYTLFCPVFARYGLLGAIASHATWNAFATGRGVIKMAINVFKAASGAAA